MERSLVKGKKGKVRSVAVQRVTAETLRPILSEAIRKGSNLHTDEALVYYALEDKFPKHRVVTYGMYSGISIR